MDEAASEGEKNWFINTSIEMAQLHPSHCGDDHAILQHVEITGVHVLLLDRGHAHMAAIPATGDRMPKIRQLPQPGVT